jgi:DNA-binding transcriptional ArsR family regulator
MICATEPAAAYFSVFSGAASEQDIARSSLRCDEGEQPKVLSRCPLILLEPLQPGSVSPTMTERLKLRPIERQGRRPNAAAVLKSLSHEGRPMILRYLTAGARSVTEVEALLGSHQAVISHHLARLRLDGMTQVKRKRKIKLYSLRYRKLCRPIQCVADIVGAG